MFENIKNIFKRGKKRELLKSSSKDTAKERLHLVLMQDRANVSADFLDLMRQEIIEVIKKYIDIDEEAMDVRLGSETNEDGTQGAPALYANIPIINIKDETRQLSKTNQEKKITPGIILEKTKVEQEESKINLTEEQKDSKTSIKEEENKINIIEKNKEDKKIENKEKVENKKETKPEPKEEQNIKQEEKDTIQKNKEIEKEKKDEE